MATKPVESWLTGLTLSPLNTVCGERRKLAIVGASMLGDDPPPLDDASWDVWGCNSLWRKHLDKEGRFRADAWFEMHPLSAQTEQELRDMEDCPVPLYILNEKGRSHPLGCSHWVDYPILHMRKVFGERDYYTSTFAYQVALALTMGYKEIGLWGVELWQGSTREARVEWPCLMWWLGMARGRGVQITLPSYSRLCWHEHLYGYDYDEDVKQSKQDDAIVAMRWHREQENANKHKARERTQELDALWKR